MLKKSTSILILFLSFGLSSCQTYQQTNSTKIKTMSMALTREISQSTNSYFLKYGKDKTIEMAKENVKQRLNDPFSAQFKDVRLAIFEGSAVVCGQVNAKNRFGAYTGYDYFLGGTSIMFYKTDSEFDWINDASNAGIIKACR